MIRRAWGAFAALLRRWFDPVCVHGLHETECPDCWWERNAW